VLSTSVVTTPTV